MDVETGDKTSLEGKLPEVRKAQNQKCRKTHIQFRRKKIRRYAPSEFAKYVASQQLRSDTQEVCGRQEHFVSGKNVSFRARTFCSKCTLLT